MYKIFGFFLLILLPFLGFAETLDYAKAPRDFQGYLIGSDFKGTADKLKQAGTAFTQGTPSTQGNLKSISIPMQTFGQESGVLVKLVFSNDSLYQISAVMDYKKDVLKNLLADFSAKYGQVASNDGGYTYTWFYFQKDHTAGEVPDFAVVLNNDPISNLKITVTFVDNAVKNAKPKTVQPPAATPTPTNLPGSN